MKSWKTLLFMSVAIALLAAIANMFPEDGIKIANTTLRMPTIHKIITPKEQLDIEQYMKEQEEARRMLAMAMSDTAATYSQFLVEGDNRFWFPNDDTNFFAPLFLQLDSAQSQGRIIRILHYGDSQIEMDRMSNMLRSKLQQRFGGGGPGLLPFQAIIRSLSVQQRCDHSMQRQAPYGDSTTSRAAGHYGPLVNSHRLHGGTATATYTASTNKVDSLLKKFSTIKLIFAGQDSSASATLYANGTTYATRSSSTPGVHCYRWQLDKPATQVSVSFTGNADLYGVMVDNGPGVAVDNIPLRGCSGQQFTQINTSELTTAYSQMDIGMIILQFGGNSVPYIKSEKALRTYASSLGYQIDHLHKCCPGALILFVGPSDMSTKIDGEYCTYPMLPKIVEELRDTATAHNAAYWSIYHAMGGKNSMQAWVSQGLGSPDYIHFSQKGADIMGNRLADALENAYQYYHYTNF